MLRNEWKVSRWFIGILDSPSCQLLGFGDIVMKKVLIAALLVALASAPQAAFASNQGGNNNGNWGGLCFEPFPGLGWFGVSFMRVCASYDNPGHSR